MSFRANIFLALLLLWSNAVLLQETKEDIEKRADNHFSNEEFLEATPLYLRLLSLEPRNHNYNYRYGTCLIFNSKEKKSAFKYLRFAVKGDEVEDEAYFYLGKAFHLTYQFKDAIKYYEKYKQKAGNRAVERLDVNRQIEMCRNGLNLLSTLTEKVVLSKQEISENDFFRIYDLSDIGGQIIVTEDFQNRQDKRNNHIPVIHIPSNTNKIFYSSYGDRGDNKDIYMRQRLPDGSWSLEQKVLGDVNTPYDEDFPFMHPNGRFLYFASKGHNSMGGYDIFRAVYDEESNTYLKPQNMDFPISSTDDDLLYIVDSLDRKAYFASRREAEFDKLMVYNVRVERFPVQIAVIKGTFESTIDKKNKDLEISITNARTGKHIGDFETMNNGSYLITLPKGGLYEFKLTVGGKTQTFKHEVDVPLLKEFKPLKQKITETIQNDNEVVLISNKFDEEFDDPAAVMAEVIQARSQMKVNKDDYDIDSLDQMREQGKILAEIGLDNFSAIELVQLAEEKVNDLELRLKNSKEELDKANIQIKKSKKLRREALKTADSLTTLAENETNPGNRKNLLRRAEQARNAAIENNRKIENAKVIKEFMEEDIEKTKPKLQKAKAFNAKIKEVDKNDFEAVVKVISENEVYAKEILADQIKVNARFELLDEIREKLKEREELAKKKESLENQAESIENEIAELEEEFENARRWNKDDIEMKLNSKKNQLDDVNREKDFVSRKLKETEELENQKNTLAEIDKINVDEEKSILDEKDETSEESDIEDKLSKLNERSEKISSEFEDDEAVASISETKKAEIINEVDDSYSEEIADLQEKASRGEISDEEIEQLQEEYIEKLKSEAEKARSAIENDENVQENKKKLAVLEDEIEKETQTDRTAPAESREVLTEAEKRDLISSTSESEKAEIINEVDDSYSEEIADLQEKSSRGEISDEEIEQLQEEYISKLKSKAEKARSAIENDENVQENKKKLAVLEYEIEKETQTDRTAPAESREVLTEAEKRDLISSTSESEKAEIINEVDDSYSEEIADLQEKASRGEITDEEIEQRQEEYIEKLKSEAEKARSAIENDENIQENKKKLAVLEYEIEKETQTDRTAPAESREVLTEAEKRDLISSTSESEKAEIINEVDDSYTEEIADLQEKASRGEISDEEVQNRQEEYIEKLKSEAEKARSAIENDENIQENKKKLAVLEDEIEKETQTDRTAPAESKEVLTEAEKRDLISSTSESEKAEIINEVDGSYSEEIADLQEKASRGEITNEEIEQRQEEYIEKLKSEAEKARSAIENDENVQENKKKLAVLEDEIEKETQTDRTAPSPTEEVLSESEKRDIIASTSETEKSEIIDEVDDSYSEEIADLQEKSSRGEISDEEVKQRQKEYIEKLKSEAEKARSAIENDENIQENKKKLAVLEYEIEKETQTDRTAPAESREVLTEAEKRDLISSTSESEKAEIINEVDDSYTEEIADLQEKSLRGEISDEEIEQLQEEYISKLKSEAEKARSAIENDENVQENKKKLAVLEYEIEKETQTDRTAPSPTEEVLSESEKRDIIASTSETEKSEIIDEVDDSYSEEIADLQEKSSRGEISDEEIEQRQEEYISKLKSEAEKARSAIENDENIEENKKKLAVLEDEIEKEMQTDRTAPAESKEVLTEAEKGDIITTTSESEKAEIINEVDDSYSEEIADLQEKASRGEISDEEVKQRQEKYLEALNQEAEKTLNKIENYEDFDENIEKLAILKDEIEKESKINRSETDESIDFSKEGVALTKEEKNQIINSVKVEEKSEILGAIDKDYPKEIAEILEEYSEGKASFDEVENRQKEYLSKLESEAKELEKAILAGENVKENKRKLAIIEREYDQESQIDLSSPDLVNELISSDFADLKNQISPGYVEKNKELKEKLKSGNVSIGEVIKNKEDFLEKVNNKIDELERKENLEDKESEKLLKLKSIRNEVNNEINELKQLQEGQLSEKIAQLDESEKDEILNKTAYKSRIEIGELENKKDEISNYELLEAKKTYINQLTKRKEQLKKKSNPTDEEELELALINEEIKKTSKEVNEIESELLPDTAMFQELSNRKLVESIGEPISSARNLDETPENYSALKKQIALLDKLEAKLIQLKEKSSNASEKKEIDKKLKEVQTKKRRAKIAFGDVEQTSDDIAQSTEEKLADSDPKKAEEIKEKSQKVNDFKEDINSLEKVIEDESSSNSEIRRANRKKNRLEKRKTKSEIELLEKTAEVNQNMLEEDINDLQSDSYQNGNQEPSTGDLSIQKDINTIKSLKKQAENTKDEEKKKELLAEANKLQNKTSDKVAEEKNKRKTKVLIDDLSQNLSLENVNSESFSEGKADLENDQIEIGLKLLDIDDKIKQIDIALETAKRRDREELEELKDEYENLRSKLKERNEKNDEKLSKIKTQKEEDLSKGVDKEAINAPVTYKEEVEMAQSEAYRELFNPVNRLSQKQYELKVKKELVESTKDEIKTITNSMEDPENPTAEEKSVMEKKLKELDEQKSEINRLRIEIDDIQQEINEKLPTDEREKKIIENLLKREVDPIREIPTLPTMSTGLVIKSGGAKRDAPIPLNPEKPKGLVFRVQVGAFSKPVPDETFDDFSPVTGEEVRPGLIRYVAGYFANRGDATGARNQIRELGYSDAFVVAYCDGERIPVYRAQQLLESGACVPSFDAPADVIVSSDQNDEEIDASSPSFEKELDEFSYNKAPGAAEAEVAESKMGLYYTVQVGVYNKPVTAKQLNNISPLITKRLPNGQMRYSSGVFDELDNAREKRQEAINLGITDAFIVAYYKGERITVAQARKLVEEHGEDIFELKNPTEVRRNRVTTRAKQVEKPDPEPFLKDRKKQVQWISNDSYMTYPSQVLNRYNQTEALFYFDSEDKRIKSFIYDSENLPKLGEIAEELNEVIRYKTLEIKDESAILPNNALLNYANEINYLNVRIALYDLNHNLMEYLIKLQANKIIKTASGGIEVQIFDSNSEKLDFNTITLQLIRLGATEIDEKSEKLKNND